VFCFKDKQWFFAVRDSFPVLTDPGHVKMTMEPFYWSADMPSIACKQSYLIKKYFIAHWDQWEQAAQWKNSHSRAVIEKHWLIPIIYPNHFPWAPGSPLPYFDPPVNFPNDGPYDGISDHGLEGSSIWQAHRKGIDFADALIDSKFKSGESIFDDGLLCIETRPRHLR
jgi:hypothetical protein